jgi:MFS family permease
MGMVAQEDAAGAVGTGDRIQSDADRRWRDFSLLCSASAASQFGGMCAATANPLLALLLTHSPVFAGWVGAASAVPALLMYLPAGWLVDHFDRHRLMMVSQAARFTVCLLLIFALYVGYHQTSMLIVAALCEGTLLVLYSAAEITAVRRMVNDSRLPSALAISEARGHLMLIMGKPCGGLLFGFSKALPYCVNIFTSLWPIVALCMVDSKDYRQPYSDEESISLLDSLKTVIGDAFLRTVVAACAIGNFSFQIIILLLVVMAEQQHMSAAMIGVLLATSGVGGLVGSMVAPRLGRRVEDKRNIVLFSVVAWGALTLIVAVSAEPVMGFIAWGGLSIAGGFLNVAIDTYQAQHVPDRMFGRVMGVNRFLTSGAVPMGALSAGYIVAALQPRAAALLVFGVTATMSVAAAMMIRPRMLLGNRLANRLRALLGLPIRVAVVRRLTLTPAAPRMVHLSVLYGLTDRRRPCTPDPPANGRLTGYVPSLSATSSRSGIPREVISTGIRSVKPYTKDSAGVSTTTESPSPSATPRIAATAPS